mmetsp:Transcript_30655/g.74288  ORF Transcript_30655/g.74288 Transcript_30655/m.74288 type:complete len:250 (+) Transcript_30655:594-1343(+)
MNASAPNAMAESLCLEDAIAITLYPSCFASCNANHPTDEDVPQMTIQLLFASSFRFAGSIPSSNKPAVNPPTGNVVASNKVMSLSDGSSNTRSSSAKTCSVNAPRVAPVLVLSAPKYVTTFLPHRGDDSGPTTIPATSQPNAVGLSLETSAGTMKLYVACFQSTGLTADALTSMMTSLVGFGEGTGTLDVARFSPATKPPGLTRSTRLMVVGFVVAAIAADVRRSTEKMERRRRRWKTTITVGRLWTFF